MLSGKKILVFIVIKNITNQLIMHYYVKGIEYKNQILTVYFFIYF